MKPDQPTGSASGKLAFTARARDFEFKSRRPHHIDAKRIVEDASRAVPPETATSRPKPVQPVQPQSRR